MVAAIGAWAGRLCGIRLYATIGFDEESGAIIRVPLDGGPVTTLASGQVEPSGIAIDATSVYWTTLGFTAARPRTIL